MIDHRVDDTELALGEVRWHCSEPDSGPDVGVLLGLGENRGLWCGEISRKTWEEAGGDASALGPDTGWWVLLCRPEPIVIAKCVSEEAAHAMVEAIAQAVQP